MSYTDGSFQQPRFNDSTGAMLVDATVQATVTVVGITDPLPAGTNLLGKVGIDQATAHANEVVVAAALPAGTALLGKVGIDQATAHANEVVVKSALPAGTSLLGIAGIDQATAHANEVVVKSALPAGTNLLGIAGIDQATAHANEVVVKTAEPITGTGAAAKTLADVVTALGVIAGSGLPTQGTDATGQNSYATIVTCPARACGNLLLSVGAYGAIVSLDGGTTDHLTIPANTAWNLSALAIPSGAVIKGKNLVTDSNYTNLAIAVW